jgi:peptidoglycan DL-endopeptidase CwlO
VTSQQLKRAVRGALATTAVLTVVGMSSTSALADPQPPANASDALKQLRDLSHQAEQLTEDYKKAEDDHAAKKADLDRANADAASAAQRVNEALGDEEKYRAQVDRLTHASYQGARLNKLSALLLSQSPNDFLDRASTLDALAKDNNDVIKRFQAAVDQAQLGQRQTQEARGRAAQAEADAARIEGELAGKKAAMDTQVAKAKQQLNNLSRQDRALLDGGSSLLGPLGGSGAAITAVNAALSKQGAPYVWGATGPSQFDCSGLAQWAYKQAGVSLPRSTYSQAAVGQSVPVSQMQPGDLVFFYSDLSHEGIYVGGGKVVHAPTAGESVKVAPYQYIGQVSAVRRVAG